MHDELVQHNVLAVFYYICWLYLTVFYILFNLCYLSVETGYAFEKKQQWLSMNKLSLVEFSISGSVSVT